MVEEPIVLFFRAGPLLPYKMLVSLHSSRAFLSRRSRKEVQSEPSLGVGPCEPRQILPAGWLEGCPPLCATIRRVWSEMHSSFSTMEIWSLTMHPFSRVLLSHPFYIPSSIITHHIIYPSPISSASKKMCCPTGRYYTGEATFQSLTACLLKSAF